MDDLWQLGDEFRGQSKASEDHQWSMITSKLAEHTRSKSERTNNSNISKNTADAKPWEKYEFQGDCKLDDINLSSPNFDFKINVVASKNTFMNVCNTNAAHQKNNNSISCFKLSPLVDKYNNNGSKDFNINVNKNDANSNSNSSQADKRFKTLPSAEILPRNEVLGGYIFVCNNDTMLEDLKRQLFGLPPRYRDSVRAITPGLPLFLYNYTTHQLHGIFEAASFGGTNIDPTAWEDKKCKGESRFPAQVRIRVRKICKALEEDSFRPILFHYDGPKFRLELSIKETLDLLDLCEKANL